jgi:dihydropteroate synthase
MSSPPPGTAPPGPLLPAGIPRIVGIVNITPDSFSDGGRYLDPAAARDALTFLAAITDEAGKPGVTAGQQGFGHDPDEAVSARARGLSR